MKRIILVTVSLVMMTTAVFADNDKPITVDQLPANAGQFIEKYFSNVKVSFAKMESEVFDKNYEVVFANGSKVEFDKNGNWKDVDCKSTQVPEGIIPQQIRDYIAANYAGAKILDIERDSRDYEIALSNSFELTFDLKFNLIDMDN